MCRWKRVTPAGSVRSVAERFELAQNHERDEARPVGRTLPDVEAAPFDRDRLDKLGAFQSVGEILFRLRAAARTKRRRHVGCDRPAVESVRAVLGDCAQRAGERRLYETVALAGRAAAGQEERVPGAAQLRLEHRPIPGHALMHRKALLGAADRGEKQFVEALRSMRVQQHLPAGDGAGDGDAMGRNIVGRSGARGPDRVERSGSRRPARAIDGDDLAAGRRVETEAIAAESGRLRLDHREHGASRHSGVDGVAAGAQHLDRGQRGDRHGGRRHPVHGIDGAASALMEVSQ